MVAALAPRLPREHGPRAQIPLRTRRDSDRQSLRARLVGSAGCRQGRRLRPRAISRPAAQFRPGALSRASRKPSPGTRKQSPMRRSTGGALGAGGAAAHACGPVSPVPAGSLPRFSKPRRRPWMLFAKAAMTCTVTMTARSRLSRSVVPISKFRCAAFAQTAATSSFCANATYASKIGSRKFSPGAAIIWGWSASYRAWHPARLASRGTTDTLLRPGRGRSRIGLGAGADLCPDGCRSTSTDTAGSPALASAQHLLSLDRQRVCGDRRLAAGSASPTSWAQAAASPPG